MKTASIRTIRHDLASVLQRVRNGETVTITHRRHAVALLTPVPAERPCRREPWAGLRARLTRVREQPLAPRTAAELLAEERDRY
jgi:antitoxin (DNA-binding transcriptional repressor) of toxin-antitoxin stability system